MSKCLTVCCVVLLPLLSARADEIDDIAAEGPQVAVPKLEALLEKAEAAGAEDRVGRLHEALAALHLATGSPYAALPHLEARAAGGRPEDRVTYAQALLAVARRNIAAQAMGRSVTPFLRDALDAVRGLNVTREATAEAPVLPPNVRAGLVLLVVECRYLLEEYEAGLQTLADAGVDAQPPVGGLPEGPLARLRDLEGRLLYALGRFADAAGAFERSQNPLGAAAAWDAARRPDKSVPLYAAAIRGDPANADLLERARTGVRFTGAHGALLAALEDVQAPEGVAGVPLLLLRAELLENTGAPQQALPLLRDVADRDARNADALVRIGRLAILTADAESEDAWDASAAAYSEALRRDPSHEGAVEGLSFIAGREYGRLWKSWWDQRVVKRCMGVQQTMVDLMPDDALAWSNLGNTCRVLGLQQESLRAYEKAREANPFDPAVESDAGLALAGAGRPGDALKAYERSLELDPGHLAGRQNAARALWLQGDDEAALKHLGAAVRTARAVGRSPGTYRFLMDRAWRTSRDAGLR